MSTSTSFTKLFSGIIFSTIWRAEIHTKVVWVTMLAMCDKHGEVSASVPGLAMAAGVSIEQCREALASLMSPDPDSRTKDHDGRRIAPIDGGWVVLNYLKYRKLASEEDVKEKAAARQAAWRQRQLVTVSNENNDIAEEEAEEEVEEEVEEEQKHTPLPPKGGRGGRRRKVDVKTTDLLPDSEKYFQVLWEDWPMAGTRKVERFGRMVDMEVVHERGSRARAERAYQKIIDAGVATPRELYGCAFIYWGEAQAKGFVQHVSTFFGPDKATWREYLTRAKEAIAIQDAEATQ